MGFPRTIDRQNLSKKIRMTLTLIFSAFTFCYIYILQPDLLSYLQHLFSHGLTTYSRLSGALIILFITLAIHSSVAAATKLPGHVYALTYIPSAVFLLVLTDLIAEYSLSKLIAYLVVLLLVLLYYIKSTSTKYRRDNNVNSGAAFISNVVILSIIMSLIGLQGNGNDVLHYELKIERLLNEKKYDEAINVGRKSLVTSEKLTYLRAFALSNKNELGEKIFEYPVAYTDNPLLPCRKDSTGMIFHPDNIYRYLGAFPEHTFTPYQFLHLLSSQTELLNTHPQIKDYLLITLLFQKKLDMFAAEIKRFYDFPDSSLVLPKHYREAMVLYSRMRTKPVVSIKDNITETNYDEFNALRESHKNVIVGTNAVRRQYGDTYWWYFYYVKPTGKP